MRVDPSLAAAAGRSADDALPAVLCSGVSKRFYRYEHRTRTLRELFIRSVLRRPINERRAEFMLQGLDLRIAHGEAVALIGRNGSGKSTALRLIAGIYPPSEGTIEVRGRSAAVIELGVGFHEELTGVENVLLYGSVMGIRRKDILERLPEVMDFAEIGGLIDEPVRIYSSGTKARLAFAVAAVCVRPDLLLLDEVLAVGDQGFRARCEKRMIDFHRSGGTMIVVTHDLESVRHLCSRAIWLENGRMRMDGPIEPVFEAYLGSF
jgi:ABC-type polysaccharide/polyol phosphate transport system ATPase subunit